MNAILHAMGQVKPVHFGNGRIVELAPDWDDEEKASTAIRKGWRIDRIMEEMMILLADGEMRRTDVIQALRSTRKAVTKAAEKLISDGHISSYEKRSASGHRLVFYCRNDPSSNVRFVKKNQVAVEIRASEKLFAWLRAYWQAVGHCPLKRLRVRPEYQGRHRVARWHFCWTMKK
jgi:hypothetical protein